MKYFYASILVVVAVGIFVFTVFEKPKANTETTAAEKSPATDEFVQDYLANNFSKPMVWKILKRDRWSVIMNDSKDNQGRLGYAPAQIEVDRVRYIIENPDGKRLEYNPCSGLQDKYIEGEKITIEPIGTIGSYQPECNLRTYLEH